MLETLRFRGEIIAKRTEGRGPRRANALETTRRSLDMKPLMKGGNFRSRSLDGDLLLPPLATHRAEKGNKSKSRLGGGQNTRCGKLSSMCPPGEHGGGR